MKEKPILKRISNRILQILAQMLPGSTSVRPFLHRLRGVKIGKGVFIGDDVYLENEYSENIEIYENAMIGLRSTLIAHFGGNGKIIIEKSANVTSCCNIFAHGGQTLRIGEGAFVAVGSLVVKDVPPYTMVAGVPAKPIAKVSTPFSNIIDTKDAYSTFKKGLIKL